MWATCHTEGCGNAEAAIDIGEMSYDSTDDDGNPITVTVDTVYCGVCGNPITDVVETEPVTPPDNPEVADPPWHPGEI